MAVMEVQIPTTLLSFGLEAALVPSEVVQSQSRYFSVDPMGSKLLLYQNKRVYPTSFSLVSTAIKTSSHMNPLVCS